MYVDGGILMPTTSSDVLNINALSAGYRDCSSSHCFTIKIISHFPVIAGPSWAGSMKKKKTHGYIYTLAILDLIEFQAFVRHSNRFSRPFRSQCVYLLQPPGWLMGIRVRIGYGI
jgi:hypothetical protein